MNEQEFIRRKFKEYYAKHRIASVPSIESREFGIGDWGKKIVKRHMSFSSTAELNRFLKSEAPLYISYSAAYYKDPSARPMEKKSFLGADLIYEFDADELELDCREKHDFWYCKNCKSYGKGTAKKCASCGSDTEQYQFICENCLAETKKQLNRLIKVLDEELGILEDISINFSGNAGYHLHIRSERIRTLSENARAELIDYLTLAGFDFELAIDFSQAVPIFEKSKQVKAPLSRILKTLKEFLLRANPDQIALYGGIKLSKAREVYENKKKIIAKIDEGRLPPIASSRATSLKFWRNLLEYAKQKESIKIDRQTSIDKYKIIRVPNSLHGSTGLIAKIVSLQALADFRPLEHALAFGDRQIKVFINKAPRFRLGNQSFGPYENEEAVLPEYAAIYLIGKGLASLCE